MPEGIVVELLIAALFVALILTVVVVARRRGDRRPPTTHGDVVVEDRPEARPATEVEAPPEQAAEAPPAPVEMPAPEAEAPPEKVRRPLRDRLAKSRTFLTRRLADVFGGGVDAETWEDLEAVLIQADVGVDTATEITSDLRSKTAERGISDPDEIRALLVEELVSLFDTSEDRGVSFAPEGLTVWMVVGVNGTGKTTTIGKLAADLRGRGKTVALAAADTFRAAADEQLELWSSRAGSDLVRHQPGADPGAVAFDAVKYSQARNVDVLIVDTAGRLHTKTPLMDELGKIRRVIEKESRVTESLLVIDATSGQNGLAQAREFADKTGVSGIVLTKLDGTAKGGIALTIERTLGIPIKLIGVGEGVDDLEPFEPKAYVQALLA